jgi:hypothetical protein
VFANLSAATGSSTAFSWTSIIILLVAAAIFYPVQKRLRENVSKRRKERWAEEDRQTQERLRLQDEQQAERDRLRRPSVTGQDAPPDASLNDAGPSDPRPDHQRPDEPRPDEPRP